MPYTKLITNPREQCFFRSRGLNIYASISLRHNALRFYVIQ